MKHRLTEAVLAVVALALVVLVATWGVDKIERETQAAAGRSLRTVLRTTEQAIDLWLGNRSYDVARGVAVAGMGVGVGVTVLLALYLVVTRSRSVRREKMARAVLEERARERISELTVINKKLQENVAECKHTEEKLKEAQGKLEKSNAQLEELASKDGLTGIANRRKLEDHLSKEWRRCEREGVALSLILFDVDFFKRYNDTYGHPAGDECLARIGWLLRQGNYARRPGDIVARYGGEEFAVILSGVETDFATQTGQRLCTDLAGLEIPHSSSGVGGSEVVTLSAGVATMTPRLGVGRAELVAAADIALYQAKGRGRNQCAIAKPIDPDSLGAADTRENSARRDGPDPPAPVKTSLRWRRTSVSSRAISGRLGAKCPGTRWAPRRDL